MGRQGVQLTLAGQGSPQTTRQKKSYRYLEEKYSKLRNNKHFLRRECLLECLRNYKEAFGLRF